RNRLVNLANVTVRRLDDRITFWSDGAARYFGYRADEALGRDIHGLLRTEFPEPLPAIRQRLISDGHWEGELVHTTRDGRRRVSLSRWVMDEGDGGEAILEVNNDVTDRKAAEQRLLDQSEELWRSNRDLENFAAAA